LKAYSQDFGDCKRTGKENIGGKISKRNKDSKEGMALIPNVMGFSYWELDSWISKPNNAKLGKY
jgi:hypothetical protein